MNTKLFCALATLALTLTAVADDQIRNVQTQLKSQGFYYGDIDGQTSSETTSAIRRYQIRNGLEVTGTLTKETLGSLGMVAKNSSKQQPPTTSQNPPKQSGTAKGPVDLRRDTSVEQSDKEFLQREENRTPTTTNRRSDFFDNSQVPATAPTPIPPRDPSIPASRQPSVDSSAPPREPSNSGGYRDSRDPRDPSVIAPPAPLDAPSADFPVLYSGTPYANAPVAVQQDTLRRAQGILANRGFYRDIIDGLPGPATEEALLTYQRASRLTLTGRLDLDTLNQLHLLPGNSDRAASQWGFEFRMGNHVFRGGWVDRH